MAQKYASSNAGPATQARSDNASGSTVAERDGGNIAVASWPAMTVESPAAVGQSEAKL